MWRINGTDSFNFSVFGGRPPNFLQTEKLKEFVL
jgi:hypothetical protein